MRLEGDGSLAKRLAWHALPPLAGTRHWCCGTHGRVLPGCCCSGYDLCQVLCPLVRPLPAASPYLAAACWERSQQHRSHHHHCKGTTLLLWHTVRNIADSQVHKLGSLRLSYWPCGLKKKKIDVHPTKALSPRNACFQALGFKQEFMITRLPYGFHVHYLDSMQWRI